MAGEREHRTESNPQQTPRGESTSNLPDLSRLSLEQMEQLIAQKRLEHSRNMLRSVRSQAQSAKSALPIENSAEILPLPDEKTVIAPTTKSVERVSSGFTRPTQIETTARFRPVGLTPTKAKARKKTSRNGRVRDAIGWTLEALVIIAVIIVVGNFILQQFGLSLDLFGGGLKVNPQAVTPARAEGPLVEAVAEGVIAVPPTLAPTITATPVPTILGQPSPTPILAGSLANLPATATPIVAPAPVIVQPIPEQPKANAKFSPPTRLVIPKLGLDTAIVEVTVDLGNWQLADYAAGHHQGTANAGDGSNMVLAGHRDIRGSVFLRLNELQIGDDFKVYSANGVYRYIVNDILEVPPTEIGVMSPTVDATATLITCTPIGIASKRLIVKARLVN